MLTLNDIKKVRAQFLTSRHFQARDEETHMLKCAHVFIQGIHTHAYTYHIQARL